MVNSNSKGDRRERELVNRLDDRGCEVMRAPASGSATERELPDVLAGKSGEFHVIEAKSSAGDPIYLDAQEVQDLEKFAQGFGGTALIAVRFDREPWFFLRPGVCHVTDSGNYRVKLETAEQEGLTLEELV